MQRARLDNFQNGLRREGFQFCDQLIFAICERMHPGSIAKRTSSVRDPTDKDVANLIGNENGGGV